MGLAPYAMSPKNDMSEMEETSVQKVGTREDTEKKTYDPYTSRERRCEEQYQHIKCCDRNGTHNERPQVHPTITEQEPDVTGDPKSTCGAADGNRGISIGVDVEDGTRSYRKHRRVDTKCYC